MKRWMGMPLAGVLALTACVTINVYFPAAEAKAAAKQFVEKVIGDEGKPAPATPTPPDGGGGMAGLRRLDPLMLIGISPAYAQGAPDITIKTPVIQSIQSRMAQRFDSTLRAGFDEGIGRPRPVVVLPCEFQCAVVRVVVADRGVIERFIKAGAPSP